MKKIRHRMMGGHYKHLDEDYVNQQQGLVERPLLTDDGEWAPKKSHCADLKAAAAKRMNSTRQKKIEWNNSTVAETATQSTMETTASVSAKRLTSNNKQQRPKLREINTEDREGDPKNEEDSFNISDLSDDSNIESLSSPVSSLQNAAHNNSCRNSKCFGFHESVSLPLVTQFLESQRHDDEQFCYQEATEWTNPQERSQCHARNSHETRSPTYSFENHQSSTHTQEHADHVISQIEITPKSSNLLRSTSTNYQTNITGEEKKDDKDENNSQEELPMIASISSKNARVAELKSRLRQLERNYRQGLLPSKHHMDPTSPMYTDTNNTRTYIQYQDSANDDDYSTSRYTSCSTISDLTAITPSPSSSSPLHTNEVLSLLQSEFGQDNIAVQGLLERLKEVFAVSIDAIENAERLSPYVDFGIESDVRGEI